MPFEYKILAWGCVLAIVHILLAGQVRTRVYGVNWNMGPRDETTPSGPPIIGRLERAQANFFETFPLVAAAILIDVSANLTGHLTMIGASLWLGARIVYVPLYAAGIPGVRSLVWMVSFAGLVLLLWPPIAATF